LLSRYGRAEPPAEHQKQAAAAGHDVRHSVVVGAGDRRGTVGQAVQTVLSAKVSRPIQGNGSGILTGEEFPVASVPAPFGRICRAIDG